MVTQYTDDDFHARLTERLQVLFVIVEQELHIFVVLEINAIGHGVPVDVGGKKHNVVEEILTACCQEFKRIQRISIIYLKIKHIGHSTFTFESVRHISAIFHEKYHVSGRFGKRYTFGRRRGRQGYDIGFSFFHSIESGKRHLYARSTFLIRRKQKNSVVSYLHVRNRKEFKVGVMDSVVSIFIGFIHRDFHIHPFLWKLGKAEYHVRAIFRIAQFHYRIVLVRALVEQ